MMKKQAAVLIALVLIVSGCGETGSGDGGAGGTAGSGGSASFGGSDGGSGGTVDPADAEAEYRASCLRDEPDTPIDCLARRLRHFERECGDSHLDHFTCLNALNGVDPFEDCTPPLDAWFECVEGAYPRTVVDVPCDQSGEREYYEGSGAGGDKYIARGTLPPNPAERRRVFAMCQVRHRQSANPPYTVPPQTSSNAVYKDDGEPVQSFPTRGFLPADIHEAPRDPNTGCGEVRDAWGLRSDGSVWSDGWEITFDGDRFRAVCGHSSNGFNTSADVTWRVSLVPLTMRATLGEVTP